MVHGIAYGYAAFTDPEIIRAHLHYVKGRSADIWADTFANMARYEKERDDAKLEAGSGRLSLVLSGKLAPAAHHMPLTLVVAVPGAKTARAERAGKELPARVMDSSIQIDAAPSADPITLVWK